MGLLEEIKQYGFKEKTQEVLEKANIIGVVKANHPENIPDISDIPDESLGSIYAHYESYCGWINYCRARRQADLIAADRILSIKKFKITRQYQDSGAKVKDIDMLVTLDLENDLMEYTQIKTDLEILISILEDAEKKAKGLSREISMRTSRIQFIQGKIDG
jgi:hypothetical protein